MTKVQYSLIGTTLVLLAGCAISPAEIAQQRADKAGRIEQATQQMDAQKVQDPPFKRLKGNYLGSSTFVRAQNHELPSQFQSVALNFGEVAVGNLRTVAKNLHGILGLSVRLDADVQIPNSQGQTGTAQPTNSVDALPLNFKGPVSDYLTQICGQLDLQWEYLAATNEVHIYRLVTRTFQVPDTGGAVSVSDATSSSVTATSGASGSGSGSGGSAGGSSSTATNVSGKIDYDAWPSLMEMVRSLTSKEGKVIGNKATNTIVVTDTKPVVDRIAALVAEQTQILSTEMTFDVREILVQLNDSNAAGFNADLVFQRLTAGSTTPVWQYAINAPANLAGTDASSAVFNSTRPGSTLSSSNVSLQALAEFGTIVSDNRTTLATRNRVPAIFQSNTQLAYLAATSPASGGTAGASGVGIPGLTPGQVTYGTTLAIVPMAEPSNVVSMQIYKTTTDLQDLKLIANGSGQTYQAIQTPTIGAAKATGLLSTPSGQTLVIVGSSKSSWTSNSNAGISGVSNKSTKTNSVSVLLITPRIMASPSRG